MSELDAEARAAIAAILARHFPDAMLDPVAPHEIDIYRAGIAAGIERAAKACEDNRITYPWQCALAIRALMGPKD